MSKRIGIFLLAIITMIGALPIEVIAAGMDDRAANLVGDTTGSLVESNDQQYSEEKNKNSETEIILESAKETAEENNKSKTVKNIQEKENIGEVNTQAKTQPMQFDVQKIQNQPQGDILREIIKNNNYGLDWNNIENYVGKEPTIEENLIEGSTNYLETPEVIGNTTLTNKIEAIINKDETGKAESITWVYKTKTEGEALEQTNNFITIRDAGLNYPLIETRKFDTTEGENTYNPYTNITYRDIQNQIQRITTGNISSPIQETSEVNSLVPNKVTQTIVKTPILAQQNSYTLIIRTETKIGREIKNSYKTFTIHTDNTITYNAVLTNGIQRENTINWLKTVVNTTDETQNFTIDLTPDNSQKVLNTIQVKKYKLTEKGYEEISAEREVKEINSLPEESAKINQIQKVENQIESKNEMTTFGMFKIAQKTVEAEKITQENKTTEPPERQETEPIETTEEVPQIVKTAPTATASTTLAASIAAEGLEAENGVPKRQETETTIEENSSPKVEDTTETNTEPKEKVEPKPETISTIPTDIIVERLNRAEDLKENFKSNTVETVELASGEIAIAELKTEIVDPKAEHTVPDGKLSITETKEIRDYLASKKEKTISLLSVDKLNLSVTDELNLKDYVFFIKDENSKSKIVTYKDIEKDVTIDKNELEREKRNLKEELERTKKIAKPVETHISIAYKDYQKLYVPITLVQDYSKITSIGDKNNIDVSHWGLNLDENKSIYTVTLDVKKMSDIKEVKLSFINSLTKTSDNIKVDRIVKTNGFDEKDITVDNLKYRVSGNVEKVTNPVLLSDDLELGYKYIFFIIKEKSAESVKETKNSNILLEIEEKSKNGNSISKKIELRTDEPSISQKLNNFRTINTNIWDSAVPIIIGNGQIEARGELEGDTITWTIKASNVSTRKATVNIELSRGQSVISTERLSGPELKSNSLNKSKYNFTLTPNNSSGEYKITAKTTPNVNNYTMTLSYDNGYGGKPDTRIISLKTQGGQEGNYRGFISARGGYLSVEDKDGKWEKALCINTNKTFPSFGTKYPFEETDINSIISLITNNIYGKEELITKIKQAIYYADTNKQRLVNGAKLTGGDAEQTFYHMIQGVIWRYTDGDDAYVAIKKHITNTQDQGSMIKAMDEIYEKSQNVQPQYYNKVKIRVFKPVNNEDFQNLISYKIEKKIIPYSVGTQFELIKLEKGTNKRLPGAKFSLKDSSGTFNKEQVGNNEGKITFSNIPPGEYTLKEEEAPIGYQKTDKTAKVTVDSQEKVIIEGELVKKETSGTYGVDVFVVENPKNPDGPLGKFILKKTDKNGRPLKGAKFSLEGNGTSRTIEPKDNEEGLTIDNLSPGSYTLKETEAPDGYTKTEETATITVDNAGNTSIKSDTNLSKDISVENDKKTLLSYDGKELNIVIAVENRYPKGTTERYSHYRTTAASIYDAFKNTPGLKGKVSIILAGTTPKNTNVVTFNIGGDFKFPDNNNAEGWMDQAFTKTAQIFGDSPNTENILITLFEGSYYGSNADRALRELSSTNINKVFNYTYSESWLGNVNNSLINRYNKLKITNLGFNSIISKSMFDENRDFYVKEYITGLDKNGNVTSADIGTHITKHQVTVATATISNEIFAKLIIKKTDKADNKELQGAEFTLTKKDGTKTLTAESTTNGIATFDNIPPGEYILKETKAPDKYKKIETEWNVYVSPTGSIFVNEKKDNVTPQEVKGEDISNKLNGTITLSTPKAPNGPLEIGKDSNGILIEGDFTATDVKAGDYFDLKISETIHYNMLQPDKPNQPTITDIAGEKIAVPTLLKSSLGGEKIIRYTFVKDLQSVKFSFKLDYSVDVYGAKNNGSYDFKASVGNTVGTINKQVSYSEGESSNDGLNMNASFDYTNDQNGKYSQVIYVNQKGSNITVPTHLEITPYVDSNYKNGYIKANISPIATAIKVYKVKSGQSLSNAVIYEKDKLEDVTDQFKDKIKIDYGKATVQFDNIGTDKYVVVVDSNMIYPQGQIQGTYLAQVASLVNNNPSSRVSMISGIATYDSSSLGTGSTYTSNKIELEIKNEKEDIKYGKFIIHKTDESGENLLVEATFKLSKKMSYGDSKTPLPETHQVKEDFQAQTKTTQKNGKVDFDNLPPGTYDLEETKSPDGYVKNQRKLVVIVQNDGKTYIVDEATYNPKDYPLNGEIIKPYVDMDGTKSRTTPINLDGRIDITGYKMYRKNISESGFDAHRRVFWMDFNLEFPEDTMPGDTFTIKLDKNLNMRGVSLEDRTQEPFIDERGKTVAEHIGTSYIDESYQFIYKVTDKFEQGEKLILSGTRPLYIDRNKIWTNDDISKTFINTIAGKEQDSFKFDNIYYGQYKSSTHYIEVGHVPFIYPKAQEVDIYVQASTYGIANPILTIEAGNLDFTNADIVISKKDGYGYIGESKERPASFGPGIMDFSNLVNSDKVDKTKGGIDITLPGDRNSNRYNVKITGAKILQKQQDISVTSSIQNYDYSRYLRPLVSFDYGIGVDKGLSQAEIKKIPKIIIKKTDESGKNFLPGATFTLTQGGTSGNPNYSQTRTTNSKGELVFTGLKKGNNQYVLTEISPPKGYEKLKSEPWKLYIHVDNQNVTVNNYYTNADDSVEINDNFVTIKNKKGPYVSPEVLFRNYKNEITFYKVDAQGNSLNGAKFKLFKGDIEVENSEKSGSIIKYEKLSSGNYLVKETQTPEDFSAPADQTAASFTVKEDGTITNVMIYNGTKLVESNEDIHKVTNTKFSGKGKFTLKKNNENQQFIPGSEFTLSKKENEKLPESFESVKKKIEDVNGIEFTGLLPGLYILKETKSPDGYKASDDYVVIVHQSGNTQVIDRKVFDILDREELKEDDDPNELFNTKSTIDVEEAEEIERDKNVFDGHLIKKLEVSDYELVSSNDNNQATVYPNKGEYLKVKFKINLPAEAKEGDYFYITYDENLNRLGNKMIEDEILPIKSYLGEELIKVTNKNGDNTYKYTLTSAVNNKQDFEIEIEAPLYVNRDKVKENALLTIKNTIPSKGKDNELAQTAVEKVYENQISVDYSGFSIRAKRSNDNIGSAIYYNTDKIELDLATGRPKLDSKGEPIKKENPSPYTISYVYLYGEKLPQDKITVGLYTNTGNQGYSYTYSAIDLFNTLGKGEADISIYKVNHPFESLINTEKLNPDIMPESFGLTEASLQTEQKLTVSTDYSVEDRPATYGQAKVLTINGGGEGNNPKQYGYVIRIKAPYETGDIPIRLFASMRRGNGEVIGFNDEIIQAKPSATINYSKAIKLVKKDSEDNTAIDGAVFKLTSVEGEEKYLQYAKTGQDSQNNISKGTLYFTKIKAGDYILEEVITPSGYQKPSSPWKVQITVDDKGNITNVIKKSDASDDLLSIVDGSQNEITVTNKKAPITPTEKTVINYPNKIKFYKVNENGEALKGAEFKLKKMNDGVKVINSIDNTSTNEFIFEKLSPGEYKLYEIKAPDGYPEIGSELEVATFTVNVIGEIEKVKTYNGIQLTESDGTIHKIVNTKTKPVYPSTGGMGTVPFVGAGVSLMALAWYELRKRKYDNKGGGTN